MRQFLRQYKIFLLIAIAAVCGLALYSYNYTNNDIQVLNTPVPPVEMVSEFNSLVPGVFILNETGEDYKAVGAIFSSVGYQIMQGSLEEYKQLKGNHYIFIVPEQEAVKLSIKDIEYIDASLKTGQKLITWGESPLCNGLGITLLGRIENIEGYLWTSENDTSIAFRDTAKLDLFSFQENYTILAKDKAENPVMISGDYGDGSFIYSGISLVSGRDLSYEHFPFVMEAVKERFRLSPAFSRDDLAFYVDIEYHMDESFAELAEKIRSYGADQINLSAWYSPEKYGSAYKELIEECHKRGISVYAWFELPLVSAEFWDKHPQWRERTASGEDAHIDWRRLMALNDPEALKEIKEYTKDFIRSFDWDGVDIAEIYFESPGQGFEEESKFTPMNDSFRKSFQERYGVDPIKVFEPFSRHYWKYNSEMKQNLIDYRVELITKLHEEFLLLCEELKKEKPYLKTSVTVIDSIADKNMREHIGVDAEAIARLQDKYHFMLQIEDPFTLWNLGPERYKVIGEEYRSIMTDGNLLSIDINVIDRGGEVYPTKKQRGVELYQLINQASKYTDKVILYALATLEEADMELVPYTTSGEIEVLETDDGVYIVRADKRFIWNTDTTDKTFYIDGVKWPFVSEQGVLVPGGEHKLRVQHKVSKSKLLIESVNGEISDVTNNESIHYKYSSGGRFYMVVNQKPARIELDGKTFQAEVKKNNDNYTIILPEGEHKVSLY